MLYHWPYSGQPGIINYDSLLYLFWGRIYGSASQFKSPVTLFFKPVLNYEAA